MIFSLKILKNYIERCDFGVKRHFVAYSPVKIMILYLL